MTLLPGDMNNPRAVSVAPAPNSNVSPDVCQAECVGLNNDLGHFANLVAERGTNSGHGIV